MSDKLRAFAYLVLSEQRAAGPAGDQEYISLALDALTDDTYQGWTNRETWAAWVDISNDETLYLSALNMLKHGAASLGIAYQAYKGSDCSGVNWDEIAKALTK